LFGIALGLQLDSRLRGNDSVCRKDAQKVAAPQTKVTLAVPNPSNVTL
jgi:hypothetical protein